MNVITLQLTKVFLKIDLRNSVTVVLQCYNNSVSIISQQLQRIYYIQQIHIALDNLCKIYQEPGYNTEYFNVVHLPSYDSVAIRNPLVSLLNMLELVLLGKTRSVDLDSFLTTLTD